MVLKVDEDGLEDTTTGVDSVASFIGNLPLLSAVVQQAETWHRLPRSPSEQSEPTTSR